MIYIIYIDIYRLQGTLSYSYYESAIALGSASAMCNLAHLVKHTYSIGSHDETSGYAKSICGSDLRLAFRLYDLNSETQSLTETQYNLGRLFMLSRKAFPLCDGMDSIGFDLYRGQGSEVTRTLNRDYFQAAGFYFLAAANRGHSKACFEVAERSSNISDNPDIPDAIRWYRRAYENTVSPAEQKEVLASLHKLTEKLLTAKPPNTEEVYLASYHIAALPDENTNPSRSREGIAANLIAVAAEDYVSFCQLFLKDSPLFQKEMLPIINEIWPSIIKSKLAVFRAELNELKGELHDKITPFPKELVDLISDSEGKESRRDGTILAEMKSMMDHLKIDLDKYAPKKAVAKASSPTLFAPSSTKKEGKTVERRTLEEWVNKIIAARKAAIEQYKSLKNKKDQEANKKFQENCNILLIHCVPFDVMLEILGPEKRPALSVSETIHLSELVEPEEAKTLLTNNIFPALHDAFDSLDKQMESLPEFSELLRKLRNLLNPTSSAVLIEGKTEALETKRTGTNPVSDLEEIVTLILDMQRLAENQISFTSKDTPIYTQIAGACQSILDIPELAKYIHPLKNIKSKPSV